MVTLDYIPHVDGIIKQIKRARTQLFSQISGKKIQAPELLSENNKRKN